jgi:hypothetical protein
MTIEERLAELEQQNRELAAEVTRLRETEDARLRAAAPPKEKPLPAWCGPQGNFGSNFAGPPRPEDAVRRYAPVSPGPWFDPGLGGWRDPRARLSRVSQPRSRPGRCGHGAKWPTSR